MPNGIEELTRAARMLKPGAIVWKGDANLPVSQQGLKVLGIPIGQPAFVREILENRSREHTALSDWVPNGAVGRIASRWSGDVTLPSQRGGSKVSKMVTPLVSPAVRTCQQQLVDADLEIPTVVRISGLATNRNKADGTQIYPRGGPARVGRHPASFAPIPARSFSVSTFHRVVQGNEKRCPAVPSSHVQKTASAPSPESAYLPVWPPT